MISYQIKRRWRCNMSLVLLQRRITGLSLNKRMIKTKMTWNSSQNRTPRHARSKDVDKIQRWWHQMVVQSNHHRAQGCLLKRKNFWMLRMKGKFFVWPRKYWMKLWHSSNTLRSWSSKMPNVKDADARTTSALSFTASVFVTKQLADLNVGALRLKVMTTVTTSRSAMKKGNKLWRRFSRGISKLLKTRLM